MNVYLVGGAVRDHLLQVKAKDKDYVVVGSSDEEMLSMGYKKVGNDFPIYLHPISKDEYALARTERKTGIGYNGFSVETKDITLEQDLSRRDLTINAMAMTNSGLLIDPFNGACDVRDKILRHTSVSFQEDPVRVLRVARFLARFKHLGFSIASETVALMRQVAKSGELRSLTPERVWLEVSKALMETTPSAFFEALREVGGLECILPEIDNLWGVPQRADYHPEIDTGVHVMMTIDKASALDASLEVRYAMLTHDVGKAVTPTSEWPSHKGHEKSGIPFVSAINKRLKVPKNIGNFALIFCENHLLAHKALELKPSTLFKLFTRLGGFHQSNKIKEFTIAGQCDAQGRLGLEHCDYPQAAFLQEAFQAALNIDSKKYIIPGKAIQTMQGIQQARTKAIKIFKTELIQN